MKVQVHLYGELKERYLPKGKKTFTLEYGAPITVLAETLRMPIDEIVVALVDGQARNLDYKLYKDSRVDLFPVLKGG